MTNKRIENLNEIDMKSISTAKDIINNGVTPTATNCLENGYK